MRNQKLNQILSFLSQENNRTSICGILRGIERETLRVLPDGTLSQQPHPEVFGSALTHPYITTDYSEALLEFITPASRCVDTTINQLMDIHAHVAKNLGEELLWPLSMPCHILDQEQIQLAHYGHSNVGQMKHLYRRGLKYRYGSMMQIISGIHFNLSFPDTFIDCLASYYGSNVSAQDFKSQQYLGLIRNFKRHGWLLTYLFGASPAMCQSFLGGRLPSYPFEKVGPGSLYLPYATSLRLSDLGYTSNAQANLNISYDDLSSYVSGLRQAIQTPMASYRIAAEAAQHHAQLNSNLLQIENEFYSPIRPKRTTASKEKPTDALEQRGIEYIEIRSLDINPFSPVGIDKAQIHFLDVFATYCMLKESPPITTNEQQVINRNVNEVIIRGRDPQLKLGFYQDNQVESKSVMEYAEPIFSELAQVAAYLDHAAGTDIYSNNIEQHKTWSSDSSKTLSARYLNELLTNNLGNGMWGKEKARENREVLLQHQGILFDDQHILAKSQASMDEQLAIEQADEVDFDTFLMDYFAQKP